ncbi:hypothetical protein CRUP_024989 [Coryphaenoides rupestris]|nr:hypothetical protein CRUP_024989 [Coryphaenoides rupestris]
MLVVLLNISSHVSDTFANISWIARNEPQDSQLYVAYMNNREGIWRLSAAVNASRVFHVIDGLEPGAAYTVRLIAKRLLDNASVFEDVIQTRVKGVAGQAGDVSKGWLIGTMCAVAGLTLVVLAACFVRRNKGGKYAGTTPPPLPQQQLHRLDSGQVKEKEDLRPDVESHAVNRDIFCEYSDSEEEEKPLQGGGGGGGAIVRSSSGDSLGGASDDGLQFNEDGSFIGEYCGHGRRRASGDRSLGPGAVTT